MKREDQDLDHNIGPGLRSGDSSYATRHLKISKIKAFAWAKGALIFDIFFVSGPKTNVLYLSNK